MLIKLNVYNGDNSMTSEEFVNIHKIERVKTASGTNSRTFLESGKEIIVKQTAQEIYNLIGAITHD